LDLSLILVKAFALFAGQQDQKTGSAILNEEKLNEAGNV
jgi:hypothetical protein